MMSYNIEQGVRMSHFVESCDKIHYNLTFEKKLLKLKKKTYNNFRKTKHMKKHMKTFQKKHTNIPKKTHETFRKQHMKLSENNI